MKFAGALRAVREHEAGDGEGDAGDDGSSDGLSEYEGRGSAGERGHEIDAVSYTHLDNLYTGNRVTLGELPQDFDASTDLHHLPNVCNDPNFAFILRNRDWKGDE